LYQSENHACHETGDKNEACRCADEPESFICKVAQWVPWQVVDGHDDKAQASKSIQ
jgi:hypothetical protein